MMISTVVHAVKLDPTQELISFIFYLRLSSEHFFLPPLCNPLTPSIAITPLPFSLGASSPYLCLLCTLNCCSASPLASWRVRESLPVKRWKEEDSEEWGNQFSCTTAPLYFKCISCTVDILHTFDVFFASATTTAPILLAYIFSTPVHPCPRPIFCSQIFLPSLLVL